MIFATAEDLPPQKFIFVLFVLVVSAVCVRSNSQGPRKDPIYDVTLMQLLHVLAHSDWMSEVAKPSCGQRHVFRVIDVSKQGEAELCL